MSAKDVLDQREPTVQGCHAPADAPLRDRVPGNGWAGNLGGVMPLKGHILALKFQHHTKLFYVKPLRLYYKKSRCAEVKRDDACFSGCEDLLRTAESLALFDTR